jgi:predicted MFS family arabinose efflux permease
MVASTAFVGSVYGPLLVPVQLEFDISFTALGALVAVPSLSRVLATPAAGYLADRVNPRRLMAVAALGLGLGSLAGALAPTFWALLIAVFGIGAAASLIESTSVAHLVRLAPRSERGRTISRGMTGFQAGMFASPIAAGALAVAVGWRSAFFMAAGVAVLAAVAAMLVIRDSRQPENPGDAIPGDGIHLLPLRAIISVLVFGALLWGGASTLRTVAMPLYGGVALELDPAAVGLVLALLTGLRGITTFLGGQLMDRYGRLAIARTSAVMNLLSSILLVLPVHPAYLSLAALSFSVGGVGATSPVVLLADRVPVRLVGRAVAALQATSGTSSLLLPLAAGALMDAAGISAVAMMLAPIFVVTLGVSVLVARTSNARPSDI